MVESFKDFGGPTVKWWPLKIFAKLHGNALLFTNFFNIINFKHIF